MCTRCLNRSRTKFNLWQSILQYIFCTEHKCCKWATFYIEITSVAPFFKNCVFCLIFVLFNLSLNKRILLFQRSGGCQAIGINKKQPTVNTADHQGANLVIQKYKVSLSKINQDFFFIHLTITRVYNDIFNRYFLFF